MNSFQASRDELDKWYKKTLEGRTANAAAAEDLEELKELVEQMVSKEDLAAALDQRTQEITRGLAADHRLFETLRLLVGDRLKCLAAVAVVCMFGAFWGHPRSESDPRALLVGAVGFLLSTVLLAVELKLSRAQRYLLENERFSRGDLQAAGGGVFWKALAAPPPTFEGQTMTLGLDESAQPCSTGS